ncbi:serine/threonine-protein kinase RsbW [Crossiella equi]|uniref:Serine/threonine-protein kinase RsbW n=1 Tax=Crossiella equi TaxID=130796 RepID=A0ABS5A3V7_9PSEU|nr:ATP-binding protein [Crossiella equi]MBP2471258.1 serine/threonine-protein kinase RsbW [Crossiella equi]
MIVLSLEIGSDPHRLPAVAAELAPVLARLFPPARAEVLGRAVREAVANAIHHGNAADPRAAVGITLALTGEELHIHVTDQGPGFVPAPTPSACHPASLLRPHGGGLPLILGAVDGVDVTRGGDRFQFTLRARLPVPRQDAAA